jgi:(1->4)-alpha-D-glucan 1-alpha-D-glucosylmutase
VLSEIADEWAATLHTWSTLNAPLRRPPADQSDPVPDRATEAMLYQTLAGCWPLGLQPGDHAGVAALAERVAQWQLKALREAKLRTSWLAPDEAYENACRDFLFDILAPQRGDAFRRELAAFVGRIGPAGAVNSLQQTVLRLTSPGVPDLYQGTELWDFSLVDPDNRRPVDFAQRRAWLADAPPAEQIAGWRDGRVKLAVVQRMLALRAHLPDVFSQGEYLPLTIRGSEASHAIAFARRLGNAYLIVIATRLATALLDRSSDVPRVDTAKWNDTAVEIPAALASHALYDWLSPTAPKTGDDGLLYLRDALAAMPVAALTGEPMPEGTLLRRRAAAQAH